MDEMMGITLDELGKRYGEDELRLVMGLMRLGMISDKAPECHGVMKIHPSKPKHWRCSRTKAVITSDSFFYGFKDIYGTMKVIYMWGQEYPPSTIETETKTERHTVAKIIKCRAAIPDGRTLSLPLNPRTLTLKLTLKQEEDNFEVLLKQMKPP